jgi:DNA transformation protein
MLKENQISEMMKLKNIGKSIAARLVSVGIESPEMLRDVGTKEVYLRFFEKEGWSQSLCPCFLYALEGAITGEIWNEISFEKKEEFKKFSKELRESLPGNIK